MVNPRETELSVGLAILSAIITFFFVQPLEVDGMEKEDRLVRTVSFLAGDPF